MSMTDDEAMNQLHLLMTQAIAARDGKIAAKATATATSSLVLTSQEPLVLRINPPHGALTSGLNGENVGAD